MFDYTWLGLPVKFIAWNFESFSWNVKTLLLVNLCEATHAWEMQKLNWIKLVLGRCVGVQYLVSSPDPTLVFRCLIRNQTSCWNLSKSCIFQPIASVWSIFALTLCPSSHARLCSHSGMRVSDCTMPTFILQHFSPLPHYFLYDVIYVSLKEPRLIVYASENDLSEKSAYQV